jgi:hypothetical protein
MATPMMTDFPTPPKSLRVLILLASAVGGLAGAAALYAAAFEASAVLWATVGFLVVLLISAGIGLLAGIGRFAPGYGLASLCIAGGMAGSALFAWRDLASNIGRDPRIGPLLLPWLGLEGICAVVIVLAGGCAVLSRSPRSWGALVRGVAFLVPAGVLLGAGYFGWGRIPTEDSGRVIALSLLLVGGIVIGALVSIGGHHLIRAFETTAENPSSSRSS